MILLTFAARHLRLTSVSLKLGNIAFHSDTNEKRGQGQGLVRISNCFPVPDEDKEEDERDDGEGEHQDPPEQPGAGLAAVQAVFARQSQPVRRLPANIH